MEVRFFFVEVKDKSIINFREVLARKEFGDCLLRVRGCCGFRCSLRGEFVEI